MGKDINYKRKLTTKIEKKGGKNVAVRVSQLASNRGISSEAALALFAKNYGISIGSYLRNLSPDQRNEIQNNLSPDTLRNTGKINGKSNSGISVKARSKNSLNEILDLLLKDSQLNKRCKDLIIKAKSNFDRPINQATLVLEDRIRKKAGLTKRDFGVNLVNRAINPELTKTILEVSSDADEQTGYSNLFRGIMQVFRNLTHHQVTDTFTRYDAISLCGFVDVLLKVVDNANKKSPPEKKLVEPIQPAASVKKEVELDIISKIKKKFSVESTLWANIIFHLGNAKYPWTTQKRLLNKSQVDLYHVTEFLQHRPDIIEPGNKRKDGSVLYKLTSAAKTKYSEINK